MFNLRLGAAALVIISCAVSGCRKPTAESKTTQQQATADAKPPTGTAPAEKPPEPAKPVPETIPSIVARVNGEDVAKADFDRLLKQMEMQAGQAVPKERRDEIYRALVDQLVTYTALVQEARNRGVQVSEAEAKQVSDARIAELRKQIPDEAGFKKALAERNMTLDRLRADIRKDLAINKMMEAELANAPTVTDADVKDFYDKNPDEFTGVRASHILIKTEGLDEAAKKQARTAIDDVLKQAKAGTDFGELAKKHSSDGSAQQGGDLGFFTKGRMVPEFSNAAFKLQPGQISDVVETQFGYHIIKVTERKDVPIAEVTEKIRGFLATKKRADQQQAFVASVKSKSKIEVLF
ncbi:MAG: peptidylprolyl isomerase [Acidobacteriota bacterium]|nr:peptidylprolyl isomerase [Acidobacteriota bacterium]